MSKFIGSVLIIVGLTIGARILTLPVISKDVGYIAALAALFITWAIMTAAALLILKISLAMDETSCTFSGMARELMGPCGRAVVWIVSLLLMYSLLCAYIAGSTSVLTGLLNSTGINLSTSLTALIFTIALGSVVFYGARSTDYVTRVLMIVKGGALIGTILLLFSYVRGDHLVPLSTASWKDRNTIFLISNFLAAFAFHNVIPSLRMYNNDNVKRLRSIIVTGTIIPLIIYIAWLTVTMGVVPGVGPHSFATIGNGDGSTERPSKP